MDQALQKLIVALERFGEKIGATAAYLWPRLVSAVVTEAAIYVVLIPILLVLSGIGTFILIKRVFYFAAQSERDPGGYIKSKDLPRVVVTGITAGICAAITLSLLLTLLVAWPTYIAVWLNPEGGTLLQVIRAGTGK